MSPFLLMRVRARCDASNHTCAGDNLDVDARSTFDYLASRGVKLVRIPFRWERLQPRLGEAVDAGEIKRLKNVVARANGAGLKVILDMHNYGGYYLYNGTHGVRRPIGSAKIQVWRFAEIWGRISNNFAGVRAVLDLPNTSVGEPTADSR